MQQVPVPGSQREQDLRGFNGKYGVNGVNGTQGPPGITQLIPGTNVYLVTNFSGVVNIDIHITVQAHCQSRDFVLNGGYNYRHLSFTQILFIDIIQLIISPSGARWEAVYSIVLMVMEIL